MLYYYPDEIKIELCMANYTRGSFERNNIRLMDHRHIVEKAIENKDEYVNPENVVQSRILLLYTSVVGRDRIKELNSRALTSTSLCKVSLGQIQVAIRVLNRFQFLQKCRAAAARMCLAAVSRDSWYLSRLPNGLEHCYLALVSIYILLLYTQVDDYFFSRKT